MKATFLWVAGLFFTLSAHSQCNFYSGKIIDQYAPAILKKNTPTEVWVRAVNTHNSTTWKADTVGNVQVLLGFNTQAVPGPDSTYWGFGRVKLDADVAPGDTATFRFTITSPTEGKWPFQWRLLKKGDCWFGNYSESDSVEVITDHYGGDSIHHIGIISNIFAKDELVHKPTGKQFLPRGANHLITINKTKSFLIPGVFNEEDISRILYRMRKLGYNSLRVLMHSNSLTTLDGNGDPIIDSAYAANIKTLLVRCREQNIYLMATFPKFLGVPYSQLVTTDTLQYTGKNNFYLNGSYVTARGQLFTDCYQELKRQNAPIGQILSWNFVNELTYHEDEVPLSLSSGIITVANGQQYDMAIANDRDAMMRHSAQHVADTWTAEMKSVDPTGLCAIGWFTPLTVEDSGDLRITVPGVEVLKNTNIDIIDVHAYPNNTPNRDLDEILSTMGLDSTVTKPVVLGEFGFLKSEFTETQMQDTAKYFMQRSCALGVKGWMFWTYDIYQPEDRFWNMVEADEAVSDAIAPVNFPNPCLSVGSMRMQTVNSNTPSKDHPNLLFYPNPVREQLVLEIDNPDKITAVRLLNSLGEVLWTGQQLSSKTYLDMRPYSAGLYYLQVNYKHASAPNTTMKLVHY